MKCSLLNNQYLTINSLYQNDLLLKKRKKRFALQAATSTRPNTKLDQGYTGFQYLMFIMFEKNN